MNMDGINVFVEVVDAQSFTRAADRLGMPPTTVSAKIARLEERLGVTLIQRTTRKLNVTQAGRSYYEHCARALAALAEGERELAAGAQEPSGLLRLTAPADLAQSLLTSTIERFLDAHPKTSVDLRVTNQHVDLIAEGVDLAIRVGPLEDSTLVVRKFTSGRMSLWASPNYLDRKGTPQAPADLARHAFVRLTRLVPWLTLKSPTGGSLDLNFPGRLASDDLDNVRTFVERGTGIGLLPDFMGEGGATATRLVRVLPDYASDVVSVFFAYPAQRFVPPAVRAFMDVASGERS